MDLELKNKLSQKRLSYGNSEKHVTNASISSMWSLAQLRASITGTISKGINSVIRFSRQNKSGGPLFKRAVIKICSAPAIPV